MTRFLNTTIVMLSLGMLVSIVMIPPPHFTIRSAVSESPQQDQDDDRVILPPNDPDSLARRDFMRTKLMYTQNIFEGLTMGDFDKINRAIKEVELVTEGEQWVTIENESYQRMTEQFQIATRHLKEAAATENIDATAMRFYELSTRCIDCHQHIRRADYDL